MAKIEILNIDLTTKLELPFINSGLVAGFPSPAQDYIEQSRQDLADVELAQATIIEAYLPAQMSNDELCAVIKEIIVSVGASSAADMGKVMGVASKQLSGKADGKAISTLVKELLG